MVADDDDHGHSMGVEDDMNIGDMDQDHLNEALENAEVGTL